MITESRLDDEHAADHRAQQLLLDRIATVPSAPPSASDPTSPRKCGRVGLYKGTEARADRAPQQTVSSPRGREADEQQGTARARVPRHVGERRVNAAADTRTC